MIKEALGTGVPAAGVRAAVVIIASLGAVPSLAQVAPAATTPTSPGPSRRVLVQDFTARGVDATVARQAAQLVAEALTGRPDLSAITMEDVRVLVGQEQMQKLMGCEGAACSENLGRAAQANEVLVGNLGRVGGKLTISLSLVDAAHATQKGQVTEEVTTDREIPAALRRAVERLVGAGGGDGPRFALPEGKKTSFAVLDLVPNGVTADTVANLTQVLSAELKRLQGASVLSRDDIQAMLQMEELKAKVGCDEVSCLAELGGALGVEHLVAGSIGRLGESYVVSLRLINVATVTVVQRVMETFAGPEDQLIRATRHACRQLVGVAADAAGSLAVSASEPAADISVDGKVRGRLPMKAVSDLATGLHALKVAKSGYFDWSGDFYVDPGETTALFVELKARPLKWYQRWWVWTIIAGTGAAVAVISLATLTIGVASAIAIVRYVSAPAPTTGSGTATAR